MTTIATITPSTKPATKAATGTMGAFLTAPAAILSSAPADPTPAVRMVGVSHRYGRVVSLREIDLEVAAGELVYLVGPSASGKTTLLKLIHGEQRPTRGQLWVDGQRVRSRWRAVRRRVGVVFQEYRLLEHRTALENVAFAIRVTDLTLRGSQVRGRALAALRDCGIGARESAYPHQLSGGQRQRLAIARVLAARPRLLLADEPTASLDLDNARRIMRLLRQIAERGTAVIVATHDRHLISAGANRVIELCEGEIVQEDEREARWASG